MASNEFHGLSGSKLATARRQLGGLGYDGMSWADWPGQGWADALSWNQSIGIYWTSKTQWANYWIYLLRLYFYAGIKSYSWSMMCTYPHLYYRYSHHPWLPNAPSYAVSRSRPSDSPSPPVLLLHWLWMYKYIDDTPLHSAQYYSGCQEDKR